jgi:hypothetical protein
VEFVGLGKILGLEALLWPEVTWVIFVGLGSEVFAVAGVSGGIIYKR